MSTSRPPVERLPTEIRLRSVGADNMDCEIRLGDLVVANFAELRQRLEQRHDTPQARQDLPCDIYAGDTVHWGWVVQAFDTAAAVGIEHVQFGVGKENKALR